MKNLILRFNPITTMVLLLLIISGAAMGQINDTVFIRIQDKALVKITAPNYASFEDYDELKNIIPGFQKHFEYVSKELNNAGSYRIYYMPDLEISIDTMPETTRYIFDDGFFVPYPWRNESNLMPGESTGCGGASDPFEVTIYFNDLNGVLSSEIQAVLNTTLEQLPKKTRQSMSLYYEWNGDSVILTKETVNAGSHNDQIGFSASVGSGLIKSEWIVNIGFEVGVMFHKKGRKRNYFYLSDDMNYVFDDNDSFQINNFLNVGYAMHMSKSDDKPNWIGLEFGYLTNKKSNFFDVGTTRLSLKKNIGKYIGVSGQLYFDSGFKRVYPGLQFGVRF